MRQVLNARAHLGMSHYGANSVKPSRPTLVPGSCWGHLSRGTVIAPRRASDCHQEECPRQVLRGLQGSRSSAKWHLETRKHERCPPEGGSRSRCRL